MDKAYSWKEVEGFVVDLARAIQGSGLPIDMIAGVPRGGWPVACLIAQRLGLRHTAALDVARLDGVPNVHFARPDALSGRRILLVEDSVDTGRTLQAAADMVEHLGGEPVTAALSVVVGCEHMPKYFIKEEEFLRPFPWDC